MRIEYINSDGRWQFDLQVSEFKLLLDRLALDYNPGSSLWEVTDTIIAACRAGGYINITD